MHVPETICATYRTYYASRDNEYRSVQLSKAESSRDYFHRRMDLSPLLLVLPNHTLFRSREMLEYVRRCDNGNPRDGSRRDEATLEFCLTSITHI